MSKQKQRDPEQNNIDSIAKEAFGYDEESLLAEFNAAEQEARELENKGSFRAESGLEELNQRLRQLDIQPIYQADYRPDEEEEPEAAPRRPARLRRLSKTVVIAAVMGVLVLGSVTVSLGRRSLRYWGREINFGQAKVVWNNMDDVIVDKDLEQAYRDIESSLGIQAVQLGYVPDGMVYQGIVIERSYANIKFLYDDKIITLYQMKRSVEQSMAVNMDRTPYEIIENHWLDSEIMISKNELANNKIEYQADIVVNDALYTLQGIIQEDEFYKMIENLTY